MSRPVTVVCFGEILWDCVPRGLFLGGAPLNVAYHLRRHGVHSVPVSAVGDDFLGEEARRRIAAWGVDPKCIGRDARRPTGVVQAEIDAAGAAHYRIARGVAWDRIDVTAALRRVRPAPEAILFGTLALREAPNRRALQRLLERWPDALRVVDLNLRAPFDGPEAISRALREAQLVKLNDVELARVTRLGVQNPSALERATRRFAGQHGLTCVCVTAGARGAGLWWQGRWFWERAKKVDVRDTIGAGDAFLAALLAALLARNEPPDIALVRACRMGEFVATRDGATPEYACDAQGRITGLHR
jgi:fructokinase